MGERFRWQCPECNRKFKIRVGRAAPKVCPECDEKFAVARMSKQLEELTISITNEDPTPELCEQIDALAERFCKGHSKQSIRVQLKEFIKVASKEVVKNLLTGGSISGTSADSVFIGTPDGGVIAPPNRGTQPAQMNDHEPGNE